MVKVEGRVTEPIDRRFRYIIRVPKYTIAFIRACYMLKTDTKIDPQPSLILLPQDSRDSQDSTIITSTFLSLGNITRNKVQNVKPCPIRTLPVEVAPLVLITHCMDKPTRITRNGGFGFFLRLGCRTLPPNQGFIGIKKCANVPESQ